MTVSRRKFFALPAAGGILMAAGSAEAKEKRGTNMTQAEAEILAECRELAVRASMLMDAGEADAMVTLYTEDLEFVRPSTWPEVSIRGRAQFRDVIARRPASFISRHLFTNMIADRTGPEVVRVRSYFTHFSGTRKDGSEAALPMESALRSVGEYDDRIVWMGGKWLIARRTGRFLFGGI